jgi:hypothetical protein
MSLGAPTTLWCPPGQGGRPYDPHHLTLRVLGPACEEAGVERAGFHTFRHPNVRGGPERRPGVVLARAPLRRVAPATYVHLLDGDLGGPVGPRSSGEGNPSDAVPGSLLAGEVVG